MLPFLANNFETSDNVLRCQLALGYETDSFAIDFASFECAFLIGSPEF